LHNAGRSAVEQGLTQNPTGGAFVEWDDAPERTRAGRRSQAQYLLAAGVGLPTGERAYAAPAEIRAMLAQGERDIADGKDHESPTELLRQLRNDVGEIRWLLSAKFQGPLPLETQIPPGSVTVNASNPAEAEAAKRFIFQTLADGLRKPDCGVGKLPVNAAPSFDVKPSRVGEIVFRDGKPLGIMCEDGEVRPGIVMSKGKGELFFSRDDLGAKTEAETAPPQPLQSFPTDEEIRAWRWWERRSQHSETGQTGKRDSWKIAELYFDSNGQLLARDRVAGIAQTALPPVVLRYSEPLLTGKDLDSPSYEDYSRNAWRKAPAPTTTTQITAAADRETTTK
jgi:hypothetical protein